VQSEELLFSTIASAGNTNAVCKQIKGLLDTRSTNLLLRAVSMRGSRLHLTLLPQSATFSKPFELYHVVQASYGHLHLIVHSCHA